MFPCMDCLSVVMGFLNNLFITLKWLKEMMLSS